MRIHKITAILSVAALLPATILLSGASAADAVVAMGELTRTAAYISAGVPVFPQTAAKVHTITAENIPQPPKQTTTAEAPPETQPSASAAEPPSATTEPLPAETTEPAEQPDEENHAQVISLNITPFDDGLDYTAAGVPCGWIYRRCYGKSESEEYITLASGAQVRNCTYDSNAKLEAAAMELPDLEIALNSAEPQVLIIHTHATESFEQYTRDYYDESFPSRTQDTTRNMVAVGTVLAETLAKNGISVVHDGTLHDYPAYTGSYDRSEETIRALLEKYPSIKIVIDLHRDAMVDEDGSRIAPVAEINGRSAAQFMIIAGCDDGRFNMPAYMENFKLAALLQNSAEVMFPGLARPVLFDYRNYNQHITTGSLLIEVGSHANSLDEALYTAELLGESMAAALSVIAQ